MLLNRRDPHQDAMIRINLRRHLNVKCDLLRAEGLEIVLVHAAEEVFDEFVADLGT